MSTALNVTEGNFAVLYVSIMGLTCFHKTTFFTFIFAVFRLNVKDIQNQFQQREIKDRHIGIIVLPS